MDKPQYFYHLTDKPWSFRILLSPRSEGCNRDFDEPNTPRICVSPSVEQCMVAIYICPDDIFYVYRTEDKIKGTKEPTKMIADAHITGERWIIKPTWFVRVGTLTMDKRIRNGLCDGINFLLGDSDKKVLNWQKRKINSLRSLGLDRIVIGDK